MRKQRTPLPGGGAIFRRAANEFDFAGEPIYEAGITELGEVLIGARGTQSAEGRLDFYFHTSQVWRKGQDNGREGG